MIGNFSIKKVVVHRMPSNERMEVSMNQGIESGFRICDVGSVLSFRLIKHQLLLF